MHWSELKDSLRIQNDERDSKLADLTTDANLEVNRSLLPYAPEIPIPIGTDLYVQARSIALLFARAQWFREIGQMARHEKAKEDYKERLEAIVKMQKSELNTRTKRVSAGTRYHTRRLFSQVKRY